MSDASLNQDCICFEIAKKSAADFRERINKSLKEQKASVQVQNQVDITPELKANKDAIIEKIEKYIQGLGTHRDKHFKFIQTKIGKLDNDMADAIACLVHLIKETEKQQKENDIQSYFNFKLFKIRKTAVTIALLSSLVLILTLFSMKQQNDYLLLMEKYYRQGIELREIRIEVDSLKVNKMTR